MKSKLVELPAEGVAYFWQTQRSRNEMRAEWRRDIESLSEDLWR